MTKRAGHVISNLSDLLEREAQIDRQVCGIALDEQLETRLAEQGAHDPDPTPYFVLEDLFAHYSLGPDSHILDVGCGTGRVLAFFVREGLPGKITGIELDPRLAAVAKTWTKGRDNVSVLQGNALDLDLSCFTDLYLFNPFDPNILQQFIEKVECEMTRACTIVHMSDNGDTWRYVGRDGWTEVASGSFQFFRNERGYQVKVYDHPQHYTVWHYAGNGLA
ncbi:MAG: class I SAM-dependent methyltransferase [Atopobiaceae bacterium]|nr:class I SAM-dependent methyltransferase [Atopobiaceae bacterium]